MIKIKNTKMHPTDKATIGGIVGWVEVIDAELVLVECEPKEAKLLIHGNMHVYVYKEEHKDFLWLQEAKYYLPIYISRTENIEEGDWVYDEFVKNVPTNEGLISQATGEHFEEGKFHDGYHFKILALPEHFSTEQLKQIVDSKLKNSLLECDKIWDMESNKIFDTIKIIKNNPHITIYPVEEKMYTQKEVNNLLAKENQSILLLINTHGSNERASMVLRDRINGLNKI